MTEREVSLKEKTKRVENPADNDDIFVQTVKKLLDSPPKPRAKKVKGDVGAPPFKAVVKAKTLSHR